MAIDDWNLLVGLDFFFNVLFKFRMDAAGLNSNPKGRTTQEPIPDQAKARASTSEHRNSCRLCRRRSCRLKRTPPDSKQEQSWRLPYT